MRKITKGKKFEQGEFLLTRNFKNKENQKRGEKGIGYQKKMKKKKNKENETSETRYFVERDRN